MKTNLISTLFIIYLLCFQHALNATHLSKNKIGSISNETKSNSKTNSNKSLDKSKKTKSTATEKESSFKGKTQNLEIA